jgi:metallo-beta-lactamase class B
VFGSSLRPLAAGDYRFSDQARAPALAAFRRTLTTLRALPCDILLTAHPDQSGGDAIYSALLRSRSPNPFIDTGACRRYADKYERLLADRLLNEAAP